MSELMRNLSEIQRSSELREQESRAARDDAQARAIQAEQLLANIQNEASVLRNEKLNLQEACRRGEEQTEKYVAKAEQARQDEKNERVALAAHIVALTREQKTKEDEMKAIHVASIKQLNQTIDEIKVDLSESEQCLSDAKEKITKVEEERNNLRNTLKEKNSLADSANVDEIGRMRGEIEVLKERLNIALERENDVEVTNKDQLHFLQLKLREGEAERRKMHNIIQDLRGNIRVIARIRPFLPSDSVPNDAEQSIKIASAQNVSIVSD